MYIHEVEEAWLLLQASLLGPQQSPPWVGANQDWKSPHDSESIWNHNHLTHIPKY